MPRHGVEIADDQCRVVAVLCRADEADDVLADIIAVDPLEAFGHAIAVMQGWFGSVDTVQIPDPVRQHPVRQRGQDIPLESLVVRPWPQLAELRAHAHFVLSANGHDLNERTKSLE